MRFTAAWLLLTVPAFLSALAVELVVLNNLLESKRIRRAVRDRNGDSSGLRPVRRYDVYLDSSVRIIDSPGPDLTVADRAGRSLPTERVVIHGDLPALARTRLYICSVELARAGEVLLGAQALGGGPESETGIVLGAPEPRGVIQDVVALALVGLLLIGALIGTVLLIKNM